MKFPVTVIFTIMFCLLNVFGEAEFRKWTAVDGKTVQASFIKNEGGMVSLKLESGKIVKVYLRKLCENDHAYIKGLEPTEEKVEQKLPFEYGKTSTEIFLEGSDKISYHMFVPETLKTVESWPVMFVFSPGGGNPGTLNRYIPGAKRNGWALVVSVQSSNKSKIPVEESVYAMVDEVIEKYPIDKMRVYASGHSGGSRVAGMLGEHMKKRDFAGLLANGAGVGYDRIYEQSSKSSVYALCGSNCFNRWDLPTSLKKLKCNNIKYVVFPGKHDWASEEYITEGISTLTAWFLQDAVKSGSQYDEECIRFAERELEEINQIKGSEPGKALMWALLLSEIKLPPELTSQVRKELTPLKTDKEALHYLDAVKDFEKLIDKHFVVSNYASCYNRADPDASKQALKLAEEYGDTSFAEIFKLLAEPSVK